MTELGFKATHPSGNAMPQSKEDISSSFANIKQYKHEVSKTEVEIFK
jgi:hypothetical protein